MKFNLIDEGWIPVKTLSGQMTEVGFRELLERADELIEISDTSPVVEASIYRLLFALAGRIYDLKTNEDWKALWDAGRFDMEKANAYFDKWYDRFWLIHPEYPFYQDYEVKTLKKTITTTAKLFVEKATGSNDTLFDHTMDSNSEQINFDEAARAVIALQYCAFCGGNDGASGRFSDSVTARSAVSYISANSLFHTLLLNLLVHSTKVPVIYSAKQDYPIWELDHESKLKLNETPMGFFDYLTVQSRRLLLGNNDNEIVGVYLIQGRTLSGVDDPYMTYYFSDKRKTAVRFSEKKAIWRDANLLFAYAEKDRNFPPRNLSQLRNLKLKYGLNLNMKPQLSLYGLATVPGKASVFSWHSERLHLPLRILEDQQEGIGYIADAIDIAEKAGDVLRSATFYLAKLILTGAMPEGIPPEKDTSVALKTKLDQSETYWTELGQRFQHFLADIDSDPDKALADWQKRVRNGAISAFQTVTQSLPPDADHLKAITRAEPYFYKNLNEIIPKEEK